MFNQKVCERYVLWEICSGNEPNPKGEVIHETKAQFRGVWLAHVYLNEESFSLRHHSTSDADLRWVTPTLRDIRSWRNFHVDKNRFH